MRLAAEEGQGWAQKVIDYHEGLNGENGEVDKGGGGGTGRIPEAAEGRE
jgi:hypothetical protein